MNIAELSIKKKTITFVAIVLLLGGGVGAYKKLGRLEDPEFTIKDAKITTPYPGASAEEVATEVTNVIEKAVQEMGQLDYIRSKSMRGLSIITPTIKNKYDKHSLPQVWDELRRKVNDCQSKLPPGAGPSIVNDDFGDVYGVYVAISGDGYSYREIKRTADMLRRELLLVPDVKRIILWGAPQEAIKVVMNREKMAMLGVTQADIYRALAAKNLAADGGRVKVGSEYITINPSGEFLSEKDFKKLLISKPGSARQIHLGDVARIERDYIEPPSTILRSSAKLIYKDGKLLTDQELKDLDLSGKDPSLEIKKVVGKPAIGLGISCVTGGNVVTMGERLKARLKELMPQIPIGITADVINFQSDSVTQAINGFIVNLVEAVLIVIVVLCIFMGLRSALLIGFILVLTILGTFILMDAKGLMLERISLGALIIALGMLVDNAIVVADGMLVQISSGKDKLQAARDVVSQNQWPLLGATSVAIIAFASIGLSPDSTGEYCSSLFYVLLFSLLLSWVTAVTVGPLLCVMFFKSPQEKGAKSAEPTTNGGDENKEKKKGFAARAYENVLTLAIRFRWITIPIVLGLFALSMYGFRFVKQSFFPDSTRPQFLVHIWTPQGTYIRDVEKTCAKFEKHLMDMPNVIRVATHIGSGAPRFILTYAPEDSNPSYAVLIVTVADEKKIPEAIKKVEEWAKENAPEALCYCEKFRLGPGEGGRIQARISGPDNNTLRMLAQRAQRIMEEDGGAKAIRTDWRQRVKVIRPILAESQMLRNGITRKDVARRLRASFVGERVGILRDHTSIDEDRIIPILSIPPEKERESVENINDLQIYSPAADKMIPLRQIVTGFQTVFEDDIICRRNRRPTITIHCNPSRGEPSELWSRIAPKIKAMVEKEKAEGKISSAYEVEWGGDYENTQKAQAGLAKSIPMFLVLMIFIVIALFNNLRQPLIIWLTVPLAMIGVTAGLLLLNQPFGFMALLGTMSLSGMLIKNAVVLIDQFNVNVKSGQPMFEAILDAGVSRTRPVLMAAATTVLGMMPLLTDAFFIAMAVAIMFGLTFATVLTLVFVPVLLATFYRVKVPSKKSE